MKQFCLLLTALAFAFPQPMPGASGSPAAGGPTLVDAMEDMNAAYRRLSRQIRNSSRNAESLELVARLRAASEASMKFAPERAADLAGDERENFVKGYQEGMRLFLAEVQKLEAALKSGDNEAAAVLLEALKEMRNDGHKRYKRPDDA